MAAGPEKEHLSVVICGHVDSGKSTAAGRLLCDLGALPAHEREAVLAYAMQLGRIGSESWLAFCMDRQEEERMRGFTIAGNVRRFETEHRRCTLIDAPGHRKFIKNMIRCASQADVAVIFVPADGNFSAAVAEGDPSIGERQGQTRQHAQLLNLLGVKQICIGVSKMDSPFVAFQQARFEEVATQMRTMLVKLGWKKDFVQCSVPVLPIAGWLGDNVLKKSQRMGWWQGQDVEVAGERVHVDTLYDVLDTCFQPPERPVSLPLRMPISRVLRLTGVGDILIGRVEQGVVRAGDEVALMPTHTAARPCAGRAFSVQMHDAYVGCGYPGDVVGVNLVGLDRRNLPRVGVHREDTTLVQTLEFDAQVQVLVIPGEIRVGYAPIGFVRCAHSACRITRLKWKMGKETGGKKLEDPQSLLSNEMAQCTFQPLQPLACDSFKNCEGLARIAFMEKNVVVMLGKIVSCNRG